jgi:tetratricopeptide (TPR) repeat protein
MEKNRFIAVIVLSAVACVLAAGCAMVIHRTKAGQYAGADASREFMEASAYITGGYPSDMTDVKVSQQGIIYKTVSKSGAAASKGLLKFSELTDPVVVDDSNYFRIQVEMENKGSPVKFYFTGKAANGRDVSGDEGKKIGAKFADALYVLIHNAGARTSTEKEAYEKSMKQYRKNPGKQNMGEDARKYLVQAEGAFNDRDFGSAVDYYYKALTKAPWYAMGHYNLAIILGEQQGDYSGAMDEMKEYLRLSPGAADARAAQDKIYDWERKAEKSPGQPQDEAEGTESKEGQERMGEK